MSGNAALRDLPVGATNRVGERQLKHVAAGAPLDSERVLHIARGKPVDARRHFADDVAHCARCARVRRRRCKTCPGQHSGSRHVPTSARHTPRGDRKSCATRCRRALANDVRRDAMVVLVVLTLVVRVSRPKVVRAFDRSYRRRRDRERRSLPNRVVLARELDRLVQIVADRRWPARDESGRSGVPVRSSHRCPARTDVVELIGEGTFGQIAEEPVGQPEVELVPRQPSVVGRLTTVKSGSARRSRRSSSSGDCSPPAVEFVGVGFDVESSGVAGGGCGWAVASAVQLTIPATSRNKRFHRARCGMGAASCKSGTVAECANTA